jgi:hypothetical protein
MSPALASESAATGLTEETGSTPLQGQIVAVTPVALGYRLVPMADALRHAPATARSGPLFTCTLLI